MEQSIAIRDDFYTQAGSPDAVAGEVIDAFDHVLEALDEVMALAQSAFPKEPAATRH